MNTQDPDGWVHDLKAAGWTEVRLHIWRSPAGALHRGPFGAWRRMREEAKAGTYTAPEDIVAYIPIATIETDVVYPKRLGTVSSDD